MSLVGWLDTDDVAELWFDAPDGPELVDLLTVAYEVCEAFAPAIPPEPDGTPGQVPKRYERAQLLQAKHVWARSKAGNQDSIGPDGYQVSTFPLVLEARSLLRPKRSPLKGLL